MDFKPTRNTQEALSAAARRAAADGNPQVDPLHMLLALVEQAGGITASLLRAVGADPALVATQAEERLARLPQMRGSTTSAPQLSRQLLAAMNTATNRALQMEDEYVSTEHLLIGLAADGGQAAALLRDAGATPDALTAAFTEVRGSARVSSQDPEGTYEALEKYGVDLTRQARDGKLDPVIGRDAEIRRVILVLSMRTRNNPVLVGDRGAGKTAVVQGLAQRIAYGDVPESVRGKRLVALDFGAMVAGMRDRSEFEERLKAVLDEIRQSKGQVIMFIDGLHTVVGAGAPDAGNILKPMLARGELQMVGTTTLDEFREYIEKDPALERRVQQVLVKQLSVEDTIAILRVLRGRYEAHHQVQISDAALVAAGTLSDRYISGHFLPGKAIDLVDEAASRLRMEIDSSPVEIDDLRRAVDRMKMEELALSRESDPASRERLERLRADLADRQEQLTALTARWEQEKSGLKRVGELKKRLDDLKGQAERAQRDGDYETASRLLYGEIPTLDAEIAEAIATDRSNDDSAVGIPAAAPMVKEEVGPDDVADVVSAWTGIPAGRLLEGDTGELRSQEQAESESITGEQTTIAGHAFMSYIRENSAEADRLQQVLEAAGVRVWRDTDDLWPGQDWREKIRLAIMKDSLIFLACFSTRSISRETSYQNEELTLAVEQMRLRRPGQPWLIPIRFDDCDIPDLDLGGGRRLGSIQRVDFFGDHINVATARLVSAIHQILKSHGWHPL
jgi:ATP-dependent Clp protease ATP-binding subunit ClpB